MGVNSGTIRAGSIAINRGSSDWYLEVKTVNNSYQIFVSAGKVLATLNHPMSGGNFPVRSFGSVVNDRREPDFLVVGEKMFLEIEHARETLVTPPITKIVFG